MAAASAGLVEVVEVEGEAASGDVLSGWPGHPASIVSEQHPKAVPTSISRSGRGDPDCVTVDPSKKGKCRIMLGAPVEEMSRVSMGAWRHAGIPVMRLWGADEEIV
jgi:hypothetical protein